MHLQINIYLMMRRNGAETVPYSHKAIYHDLQMTGFNTLRLSALQHTFDRRPTIYGGDCITSIKI